MLNTVKYYNEAHSNNIFIEEDFEYRWKEGTIRGWEKRDLKDIKSNPLYCQACRKLFTNEHTFVVILFLINIILTV